MNPAAPRRITSRRAWIAALAVLGTTAISAPALAIDVPSPANSTTPATVTVSPDGSCCVSVVVRGFSNTPIAGASVQVALSNCPIEISSQQAGLYVYGRSVYGVSNASGVANLCIRGCVVSPCTAAISADGVALARNIPVIPCGPPCSGCPAGGLLTHAGFEGNCTPNDPIVTATTAQIPGWSVPAGEVRWLGSAWQAADTCSSVELNGDVSGSLRATFVTSPGRCYTLSFAMSGDPMGTPAEKTLEVSLAGGATVAPTVFSYTTGANTPANMLYARKSLDFTASLGGPTTLVFTSTTPGSAGPVVDDIGICPCAGCPFGDLLMTGSFESECPVDAPLISSSSTLQLPGWTVPSGTVQWLGSSWEAADGCASIDLNGDQPGTLQTTLSTKPGQAYTLEFDLAGNPDGGPGTKTLDVDLSGGATLGAHISYQVTAASSRQNMSYQHHAFPFIARPGGATTLRISSTTPGGHGPVIDDIEVCESSDCPAGGVLASASFEGDCPAGTPIVSAQTALQLPDWTVPIGNVQWVGSTWEAADGCASIDLNGDEPGALETTFTTSPGECYTLSFDLSGNPFGGAGAKTLEVSITGGAVVPALGFAYTVGSENSPTAMRYERKTYVFMSAQGGPTTLRLTSTTPGEFGPVVDDLAICPCPTPCPAGGLLASKSFESGCPTNSPIVTVGTATQIWGWTVPSGDVQWVGATWQASDGCASVELNGNGPGSIATRFPMESRPCFTIDFDLSANPDSPVLGEKTLNVSVTKGGSQVTAPIPFSYNLTSANTRTNMLYQHESLTLNTFLLGDVDLRFTSTTAGAYGPVIDNVDVCPCALLSVAPPSPRAGDAALVVAPNPFGRETQVRLTLAVAQTVDLRIFDVAGRSIRTLRAGRLPIGTHTLTWDGRDTLGHRVSSGVYFVRARAGDRTLRATVLRLD